MTVRGLAAVWAGRRRPAALRALGHWLLVGAALGYIASQVPPLARAVRAESGRLDDLHWGWGGVAVLLNLAAIALYAELHRQLLAVGDARLRAGTVQSVTFVQNAISGTVPVVGGAAAVAYAISRFRRCGVDSAVAAWAVLLSGTLTTLCLVVLGAIALAVVGAVPVPVAVLAVVMVSAGGVGAWMVITRPATLGRLLRPLLPLLRFAPGQCRECRDRRAADLDGLARRVSGQLALLRPSTLQWLGLLMVSVLTWVSDFADLTASAAAAVSPVPWAALVRGFVVVQASIALQVLPGGAGLAEVGLLGALVAGGVTAGPAAATVLIYRLSSWLLPSVLGWIAYGVQLRLIRPRPHRHQVDRPTRERSDPECNRGA